MTDIPHNWTPTFKLTSIEKPDMSPYLFHMTTEESLQKVLEDQEAGENKGRLIAQIPRHCKNEEYRIPMVCFTETPPFALDFFRYRWSDNKDRQNLKYGIGFDKSSMVKKRVFPTFYVNKEVQSQIFCSITMLGEFDLENLQSIECKDDQLIQQLKQILENTSQTLESVKRLMFPLLENNKYEGYIWEREWRYTSHDNADFIFSYADIRIICCTDEDENNFKMIIGEEIIQNNPIKFIRTWEQYDEITDFINNRSRDTDDNIKQRIQKVLAERKGIESYLSHFAIQEKHISKIKNIKNELDVQIKKIALIRVFEEISKNSANNLAKKEIMDNEYEVVIKAIAAYSQYRNKKVVNKPSNYLIQAIQKQWKPSSNQEKEITKITNLMNNIIEKDLELDIT